MPQQPMWFDRLYENADALMSLHEDYKAAECALHNTFAAAIAVAAQKDKVTDDSLHSS